MARKPNMALLMLVSGSLAHRKILVETPSDLPVMLPTFDTKHALSKIIHEFSHFLQGSCM